MMSRSCAARGTMWVFLAVFASLIAPPVALGATETVFGPLTIHMPSSPPYVFDGAYDLAEFGGNLFLQVVNGNGAGDNVVTSATITLNGTMLVGPGELTSGVTEVVKLFPGFQLGTDTWAVEFGADSAPGSYIVISIIGDHVVRVVFSAPTSGSTILSDRVTASGTCSSYTESFTLSVNGIAATCAGGSFTVADVPLASGSNTLVATLTSVDGFVGRDSVTVTSNAPPVANAGKDKYVATKTTATVDGRLSYDPDGGPITYLWQVLEVPSGGTNLLNDRTFATPSFTPRFDGHYVLSLTVNDGRSNSAPDNVVVTAGPPNVPPVAEAGPDQSAVTGSLVSLSGSASSDADNDPLAYSWQFLSRPDGSQATLNYPLTVAPNFLADLNGQYVAELTVFDGKEYSLPDNVVVTAATPNAKPVANAGPDNTVSRNTAIYLNGTQSYDPDNTAITYLWSVVSQPSGSTSAFDNAASPTPAILADVEGQYVFRLVVNDGELDSDPSTTVVTSVNDPPVADAGLDQTVTRNTLLTLNGSGSSDANGDPLTYLWSIAAKPAGSAATLGNPTVVNPVFTPDLAGAYVVSLTVNDGRVDSAPDNVIVTATPLSVTVPDVSGMIQADAQTAIVAATLAVGAVTTANSDNVASGNVISQSPAGGSIVLEGSAVDLLVSLGPVMVTVPDVTGMTQAGAQAAIVAAALAAGSVTQEYSATVAAGNVIGQSPAAGTVVVHGTAVDLVVSLGPPPVPVPDVFGKPQSSAQSLLASTGLTTGTITTGYSETVIPGNVMAQSPAAGTQVAQGSAVDLIISSGPAPVTLPPDPALTAPPVDPTVATSVYSSTQFLYTGDNAVQTGMAEGTIELKRAAVLRGKVMTADNAVLSGVTVTILGHPEFGQTLSREDGLFDMAINGGGLITVSYRKGGYLSAQRQMNVPWQDYTVLPDVVLVPYDSQVTTIDLTQATPIQVARGSVVTDADGTRQATLFFSQGTQATMVMPDNTTRPLTSLSVRATEYTVGENGPKAMPAALPPTVAYTYCVELSVDVAVSAGASSVQFDLPVIHYVENFLGFPVGGIVPVGYYDREMGLWVPSDNGRVIKILSVTGGLADLDTNGDTAIDNAAVLSALGVTDAERTQLTLYPVGTSLWRVPVSHFSPLDLNWNKGFSDNAVGPSGGAPVVGGPNQCYFPMFSSIIECENQVLGEKSAIAGTPYELSYRSSRTPGYKSSNTVEITLSGSSIPSGLTRILLETYVAGRRETASFAAAANRKTTVTFDGLDAYGRPVQGSRPMLVRVGYAYGAVQYSTPAEVAQSFAKFGSSLMTADRTTDEAIIWQEWTVPVNGSIDARAIGLGGWTLDVHHLYDPAGGVLYKGDGTDRRAADMQRVITTYAGNGIQGDAGDGGPAASAMVRQARGVAFDAAGNLYIADTYNHRIRKVDPDGTITAFAGTGTCGFFGDGGPAISARICGPYFVAVDPDGNVLIDDYVNHRIRRVDRNGIISTVAGNGTPGFSGDGGPATDASLHYPLGLTADKVGNIYFADQYNHRIRKVDRQGIITTFAGNGYQGYSGDGGPATDAKLNVPDGVAADEAGNVYVFDTSNARVRKVDLKGTITTVAGGKYGFSGDGGPATSAALLAPIGGTVDGDGNLYIADMSNNRIRKVDTQGIITTIAGNGIAGYSGDGGSATAASLYNPNSVAVDSSGKVHIADFGNSRIRRIGPPLPGLSADEIAIASGDGSELYVFSGSGKHLRTVNTSTGGVLRRFVYDVRGLLSQVFDGDNNATTVERDALGTPTALVAPGGQRTVLSTGADGYLASVADPGGNTTRFDYTADGLMTSYTDPNGYPHTFHYDSRGRLDRDEDPEGGFLALARTDTSSGYYVTATSALGRTTKNEIQYLSTGEERRIGTSPSGARSQSTTAVDGKWTATRPDGTVTEVTEGPDPRWGLEAPVSARTTVRTPLGLVSTTTTSRSAVLSDPDDPLSLISWTDNMVLNGKTWTRSYDAANRRITLVTPVGRRTITAIDNQGRTVLVNVAPSVDNIAFAYDTRGRLAETTQGGKISTFGYDDLNRLTTRTDPLQHQVQYAYDNADRVSRVILPSGRTYGFGYDPNGNRTSITMPNGAVHQLGYNKVNLDNAYTPPGNPPYATGYNLGREWTRVTLPSGRTIDGAYDNGGRLIETVYPEASISYTYNDNTTRAYRLTRTSALDNTTQTIEYGNDGFLTTKVAFSGQSNGEYRFAFDNNFWMTGVALDNVWTLLSEDADGQTTRIGSFSITRGGPAGAPSALTDNTLSIGYTYDSIGRLWTRTHTVSGAQIYQITLAYDNVGRISRKTEVVSGTSHVFDYAYDPDGQLFEVRRDGILVEQYGYDNNSNRTSTLTTTATYDEQDRLTEQGGVSYIFDDDGYLITRGTDTFAYSARGELLSATVAGQIITYHYDGIGRRIGKTEGTGTTQYLYGNPVNAFQVTASRDAVGNLTKYLYDTAGNLFCFERNGQQYYVATDQLGTPTVVTEDTGAVVKVTEYDSWGVKTADGNPSLELPIGFAGGIDDSMTGLVRFGFRDYETTTGRWAAKDPTFFEGGQFNLYSYVLNDPSNSIDLTGLDRYKCCEDNKDLGRAGKWVCKRIVDWRCSGNEEYCCEVDYSGCIQNIKVEPSDPRHDIQLAECNVKRDMCMMKAGKGKR